VCVTQVVAARGVGRRDDTLRRFSTNQAVLADRPRASRGLIGCCDRRIGLLLRVAERLVARPGIPLRPWPHTVFAADALVAAGVKAPSRQQYTRSAGEHRAHTGKPDAAYDVP